MRVRVDVLPVILEARRVLVAEVIGGYFGQAALGRWWLPSGLLAEGEQPEERAVRIVREQLGLDLDDLVVVGAKQHQVAGEAQLGLAVAASVGGEPDPKPPVSGFSARTSAELPDQIGFYHRDEVSLLVSRYERLRTWLDRSPVGEPSSELAAGTAAW